MSNPLGDQLQALSAAFAQAILDAIQMSSLAEILEVDDAPVAPAKRGPGRPPGPPRYQLDEIVALLVPYVRSHPGLAADGIRTALGLERHQWSAAVAKAIATNAIRMTGTRRGAKYFPG